MSSSLTRRNADISLKALAMGAADYVSKPTARGDLHDKNGFQRDLVNRIKGLAQASRLRTKVTSSPAIVSPKETVRAPSGGLYGRSPIALREPSKFSPAVLAIGSSTGGPHALFKVFENLKTLRNLPIVVTQHMPATFTAIFAEHLARASGRICKEGVDGEILKKGQIYIAPGDYHMVFNRRGGDVVVELNQAPAENFRRPAVDPMLRSLADDYGGKVLTVIMTAMGHDGLSGGRSITDAGGAGELLA